MKKMLSALALIILMSFSCTSFADNGSTFSARQLNELCYQYNRTACIFYMAGFFDGAISGQYLRTTEKSVTVGTLLNIFKQEMSLHPEKGDEYAGIVISQLLVRYSFAKYTEPKG
jgi:hypothetical protein